MGSSTLFAQAGLKGTFTLLFGSPEDPCVKELEFSLMLLGSGGTFKRWNLVESLMSLGYVFKEHSGTQSLSSALSLPHNEVTGVICHMLLPSAASPNAQAIGSVTSWSMKLGAKLTFLSF
jgi:hypothetical protein